MGEDPSQHLRRFIGDAVEHLDMDGIGAEDRAPGLDDPFVVRVESGSLPAGKAFERADSDRVEVTSAVMVEIQAGVRPDPVDRIAHGQDDPEIGEQLSDVADALGVQATVERGDLATDRSRVLPFFRSEVRAVPVEVLTEDVLVEELELLRLRHANLGMQVEGAVKPGRTAAS